MAMADEHDPAPGEPGVVAGGRALGPDAVDKFFMGFALAEAAAARDEGEVPIGAIVVLDGEIVGRGHNQPIGLRDPTAHAEIIAIREAACTLRNYRLVGATMYVTIEPCAMCAGALVNARVRRLVYGAPDARAGAIESVFAVCSSSSLNHEVEVLGGVCADEARDLMKTFFRRRRNSSLHSTES